MTHARNVCVVVSRWFGGTLLGASVTSISRPSWRTHSPVDSFAVPRHDTVRRAVCVFGGAGPDRFKLIVNCARDVLSENGFIQAGPTGGGAVAGSKKAAAK